MDRNYISSSNGKSAKPQWSRSDMYNLLNLVRHNDMMLKVNNSDPPGLGGVDRQQPLRDPMMHQDIPDYGPDMQGYSVEDEGFAFWCDEQARDVDLSRQLLAKQRQGCLVSNKRLSPPGTASTQATIPRDLGDPDPLSGLHSALSDPAFMMPLPKDLLGNRNLSSPAMGRSDFETPEWETVSAAYEEDLYPMAPVSAPAPLAHTYEDFMQSCIYEDFGMEPRSNSHENFRAPSRHNEDYRPSRHEESVFFADLLPPMANLSEFHPRFAPPQTRGMLGETVQGTTEKTLMIRGIPCSLTQEDMMRILDDAGFAERYNFFYMPRFQANLGYAFVNFFDEADAQRCNVVFNGRKLNPISSEKVCTISAAHIQGIAKLKKLFRRKKSEAPFFKDEVHR